MTHAIAFSCAMESHRDLIIGLAAKYKQPAVYISRQEAAAGGLISYGPSAANLDSGRELHSITGVV